MKFETKVFNFFNAIQNVYKSEEDRHDIQQMELDDENISEDITALVFATTVFMAKVTGQEIDVFECLYVMNRLALQQVMTHGRVTDDE